MICCKNIVNIALLKMKWQIIHWIPTTPTQTAPVYYCDSSLSKIIISYLSKKKKKGLLSVKISPHAAVMLSTQRKATLLWGFATPTSSP